MQRGRVVFNMALYCLHLAAQPACNKTQTPNTKSNLLQNPLVVVVEGEGGQPRERAGFSVNF